MDFGKDKMKITKEEAVLILKSVLLSRAEAEVIFQALGAAASDQMRYRAWEVLDFAVKRSRQGCKPPKEATREEAK
jgi:hypothetical protein